MTTTIEFITALFCQVDDHLAGLPKHPEAHLWPSEVVTLGLLHALKGVGNRPFSRWLTHGWCPCNGYKPIFGAGYGSQQRLLCVQKGNVPDIGTLPGLTPGRFTGFTLPAAGTLLCTKWAGLDKMLGTGDDICEAFSYPSCMAGQSVSAVLAAANQQLALGSNPLVQASRC